MSDLSAREFVADFFGSFTREVMEGGDAAAVVDRYYTPDIEQIADGVTLDRQRLIDHLRPVRKNLVSFSYDVHEAIRAGDRVAARFTIHAELRRGRTIATEVYLFGELAPDGRMRRTTQATRDVTAA
ncbi:nuclear transport factor 2 family protein [Kribbella sp. NPDC050459]|uniref:nuclear transport factor 2 family protein n=1 Tax=Kribbella sp. NPDC050459 TaxID=3155785 RepID=UPI0034016677